jgi:ABC-type nitrate/sulfonate/bicarbonate transport system permease component
MRPTGPSQGSNSVPPGGSAAAKPQAWGEHTRRSARLVTHRVLLPLVGVTCVLAVWSATLFIYRLPAIVLPSPWSVAVTLIELIRTPAFWHDVGVSLYEFGVGYLIGTVLGVAVGMLMGEWRHFRMASAPVIESLRFVVPFAWIPLTILWFGTSYTGKILLVAYAVFFVMVVSKARAVAQIDPTLSRVGTMLGMGPWRLAWQVHLRAAAPTLASAARAAAAIGWIAVVAAEYIGASAGLGLMITNAATSLTTSVVIAGMIVIGVVGAGVSALIGALSRAWLDYR